MSEEDKVIAAMEGHFREIITLLGEDVNREGLVRTPERAAKAFHFLTRGYRQSVDDLVDEAVFTSDTDEMVIVRNIEMYSLCEHHMLPFIGKCHVAYLPDGRVLGLSKIARIVDLFARRLQIQEVLTKQIAECRAGRDPGQGRRRRHRGPAHVHDDARRGEAELGDDDVLHAGQLPLAAADAQRVPRADRLRAKAAPAAD